jgi:hypothetical protein
MNQVSFVRGHRENPPFQFNITAAERRPHLKLKPGILSSGANAAIRRPPPSFVVIKARELTFGRAGKRASKLPPIAPEIVCKYWKGFSSKLFQTKLIPGFQRLTFNILL